MGLLLGLFLLAGAARAGEPEIQYSELRRVNDGAMLTVRLGLGASPAVEDALLKGVPVYFVWQAEVYRKRWYWTDKRVGEAVRVLRLVYQPLTRRWRVSLSTGEAATAASLQYALHQSFDSLPEALGAISRVADWQIVEAGRLDGDYDYRAQWRFRLELDLLPRPFQIGVSNQPGWLVEVQHKQDVPYANSAEAASPTTDADSR